LHLPRSPLLRLGRNTLRLNRELAKWSTTLKRPAHVHVAADKIEPRLARAIVKAVEQIRSGVSINMLAALLHVRDIKGAVAHTVPAGAVRAAFAPVGAIMRDARTHGRKVGKTIAMKAAAT
jgi:hypothetical protein